MSRRKRDTGEPPDAAAPEASRRESSRMARDHALDASRHPGGRILRDLAVLLLAFGAGAGIAELFGAANLGVAFGVGQIAFAIALVVLLTRG
jgi:hypothetical protein